MTLRKIVTLFTFICFLFTRTPDPKKKFNTLNTPRSKKREQGHNFVNKTAVRMETCGPVSG
jgi:hypothetical protein